MKNIVWYAKAKPMANNIPTLRYSSKRKRFIFNRAFVKMMQNHRCSYYAIGFEKETLTVFVQMSKEEGVEPGMWRNVSPKKKCGLEIRVPALQTDFEILGFLSDKVFEMSYFEPGDSIIVTFDLLAKKKDKERG